MAILAIAACSKEENDNSSPTEPVKLTNRVYSGDELKINVSDAPAYGKVASVIPDASNMTEATFEISGQSWTKTISIVDIIGMIGSKAATPDINIPTAGILPGSTEPVSVRVNVTETENGFTFKSIDGQEVNLDGALTLEGLSINADAKVPANEVTGEYKLFADNPLYFKSDAKISIAPLGQLPLEKILGIILSNIKIKDTGKTIPALLVETINKISLLPDGNIQCNFNRMKGENPEKNVDSPLNMATYYADMTNLGQLNLNINPYAIKAFRNGAQTGTKANGAEGEEPGLDPNIFNDINNILDALTNYISGIEMRYMLEEGKLNVYIDYKTLTPVIKAALPLLKNQNAMNSIFELIKAIKPDMPQMAQNMLKGLLLEMGNMLEKTTELSIGLRLQPIK